MTIEKLKFKHKCIDSIDTAGSNLGSKSNQNSQQLSAFEKFKNTPKYLEILKNLGKAPL